MVPAQVQKAVLSDLDRIRLWLDSITNTLYGYTLHTGHIDDELRAIISQLDKLIEDIKEI